MKMKISISRQHIYLLLISLFLLVFVFVFSFGVLIPKGKDYRKNRLELRKEKNELKKYQNFHTSTQEKLKKLEGEHRHIINAFGSIFNPDRFEKQFRNYFMLLKLAKLEHRGVEKDFEVYEVNTSSHISSPTNFYQFLDAVNKSDWIIAIDFPIDFQRDGEIIHSSFTMKVYCDNKESNNSKVVK